MKKLSLLLMFAIILSIPFCASMCDRTSMAGVISNSEVIPFTTGAVVTFTTAKINDVTKSPPKAIEAYIFVYGSGGCTVTVDGTTPTTGATGTGIQVPVNGTLDIVGQENVRDFQAIGTTTTGSIYATYFFAEH